MARNRNTPDWRVPCFAFAANVRSVLLGSGERRFPKIIGLDSMECGVWICRALVFGLLPALQGIGHHNSVTNVA
jgi:hypothetical protein